MSTKNPVLFHLHTDPRSREIQSKEIRILNESKYYDLLLENMTTKEVLTVVNRINKKCQDDLNDNQTLAFKHLAKCLESGGADCIR